MSAMATKRNPLGLKKFDAADYINDAEDAHYFLAAALEHDDLPHLIKALGTVCRALGVAKTAKAAGMTRDNLYKTLADGARPSFATINSLLKVFEIDLLAAAGKNYKREKRQTPHTRAA
jgi:probable addiction module antidote protein